MQDWCPVPPYPTELLGLRAPGLGDLASPTRPSQVPATSVRCGQGPPGRRGHRVVSSQLLILDKDTLRDHIKKKYHREI